ncbi:MAG: DUF1289 domain-containing protein [Ramlibacter sp.]
MSDPVAHVREGLARLAALAPDAPVPSPCNDVCRIDGASGLCQGCLRTIDEIAAWGSLGEAGRCVVWARLGERADKLAATPRGSAPRSSP